jgi:hypothetical protein
MRVTAYLARQWYRDVLRDMLPAPIAGALSKAVRAVLVRKGAMPGAQVAAVNQEAGPLSMSVPPDLAAATGSNGAAAIYPAETPIVGEHRTGAPASGRDIVASDTEDQVLPPTALYLPVGDPAKPEPTAAPARYLPAQDLSPLPEPSLAIFIPDPHPASKGDAPSRESATLEGLIFTAVLSPKDGRKNWQDILTAFCTTFREKPDATLVLKMIGSDAAFWWWEFHDIIKALPPFSCRVLVVNGFLDDETYTQLISATHFVVNASLAEGQCLPLVEFMSAGRPAIAPRHTAMLDYITQSNAVIVESDVEFCSFPHDPRNMLITTRYRIDWLSLNAAFAEAARIVGNDTARYAAMGESAASSMSDYCSDEAAGRALASFLGFGDEIVNRAGWQPKPRVAAEPLLESLCGQHTAWLQGVA